MSRFCTQASLSGLIDLSIVYFSRNQPLTAAALLKGGADGNKRNKNKCSPLHVAVNKGYSEVVKTLLSYSCNANAQVCMCYSKAFRLCGK